MNLRIAATANRTHREHRGLLDCARFARPGKDVLQQD
jgi:hypothetical protein